MVVETDLFQRGQMELALWRTFGSQMGSNSEPPPVFRNRIKRLLDMDQADGTRIFAVRPPTGRGDNAEYDPFGVFQMALALILLDAGYKQGDAVFLLRWISVELASVYMTISDDPPAVRQQTLAKDRPDRPTHPEKRTVADESDFLLLRKVEMTECYAQENRPEPLIIGPTFCRGLSALQKEMERLNYDYPAVLVVEIGEMIAVLNGNLAQTELLTRGRKKADAAAADVPVQPSQPIVIPKQGRLLTPRKRKAAASQSHGGE